MGADGIEPDTEKFTAICNMTAQTDVNELQTFLGMANYLDMFTTHLATVSAPLRDVCKTNVPYDWGPEHDAAFSNLKKAVSSNEVLRYYDSTKPLVIQVDASQRGLGAALLQANGPIAFASKSLAETESRYSNIEREMLGIGFGLVRFHQYIYGRHVEVHTDHKPLESIYTKHLFAAPPRLAHMLLRIKQFDVSIKYVPGSDVKLADTLSRANPCNTGGIRGLDLSVHELHVHLNASPTRIVEIRMETSKDITLHALCETISIGWPENRAHYPARLMPFWNFRDELSVEHGLIPKGQRIILPKSLHAAGPLCTPRSRKMQASCKGRCLLVWYQS